MTYTSMVKRPRGHPMPRGREDLPNWETQDSGFLVFVFWGWNSIRQEIAEYNKYFPNSNGI